MLSPSCHDLSELERRVCQLVAHCLGIDRSEARPESRMIEDLHLDSLDMVEVIMALEEEFDIEIPDKPSDPVAKRLFTRNPFRLRDLAEVVYLQQQSHRPDRSDWQGDVRAKITDPEIPFSQLSGCYQATFPVADENLFEPLECAASIPIYRRLSDGMRCMLLPAAEVTIGSDETFAQVDESPAHSVQLESFLIDAEPVSTTAFCRFLNSTQSITKHWRDWFLLDNQDDRVAQLQLELVEDVWRPVIGTETMPMVLVSWYGANAYSLWANGWDWRSYETHEGFLPTEAQWEYAAQGAYVALPPDGTANVSFVAGQHQPGRLYNARSMPMAPVHAPLGMSDFGLHHMAGNVWQWCRDWYADDFYRRASSRDLNPVNRTPSGVRSERGGSWVGPAELCRPSYRRGREPQARGRCLGFRCVGNLTKPL